MLVEKPPITESELRRLLQFALSEAAREGMSIPDVIAIFVVSKGSLEKAKDLGEISDEYFVYRETPVDTIIICGDIHTNVFVLEFLKAVYSALLYRTALIIDMRRAEEWARARFIKALSYMVS
ncbi:MAG: hypothetical protein DRJ66_03490 [Thermoprotei archaeon]|nr:MAG: hypothetical protein DRJ66_03490 [Thermoprotei archaeon]RLF20388.1 MAG: hypothetical protein DRZ82_02375 [Thermoprotei archaeon]